MWGPEFSLEAVEQWDNLRLVGLMMVLEQQFGIRIDVQDAVEMTSFTAVCEIFLRYLGDKS